MVEARAKPEAAMPMVASRMARGPWRSAMAPAAKPEKPPRSRFSEKASEMAPRLQPKASASAGRKTPKEAMALETVKLSTNSAATTRQRSLTERDRATGRSLVAPVRGDGLVWSSSAHVRRARVHAAPSAFGNVVERVALAAQAAAPEGRVRDEGDAELAAGGGRLLPFLPVGERVLRLHRGEGMDLVTPADRRRRGLAEADRAHLALLDEPSHPAHRLLDGHARVDAVLVVEVDDLDAEPLEARVARLADVLWPPVDEVGAARRVLHLAELGAEHGLASAALQ